MAPLSSTLPVAVIGAGPVGLAAAAHLLCEGFTPLVLEASPGIAGNLESYRHVRLFSPWRYNIDREAGALLAEAGWQVPAPDALPTAGELIDHYLAPLSRLPVLAPHIRLGHQVREIARQGFEKCKSPGQGNAPFVLQVDTPDGPAVLHAQAIIDAAGTWSQPNRIGAHGVQARGERDAQDRIAYGMPDIAGRDSARYAGKRVLVVGGGHSAAGNLIALAELARIDRGASIAWAVRADSLDRLFGGALADELPARGALGSGLRELIASGQIEVHTNFHIKQIELVDGRLRVRSDAHGDDAPVIEHIDAIIASTGARPDLALTRYLRVRLDLWLECSEALAPLIDPALHSCGSVRPHGHRELAHPEANYYTVGAKSYGRAPNFLMATGYEQVRSVVAALAGKIDAANDVLLELPETGVCSARSQSRPCCN